MDLRVKVTSREIFLFSLHHYYHSVPGFISIGCTILALGAVVATWPAQPGFMKAILAPGSSADCLHPAVCPVQGRRGGKRWTLRDQRKLILK